MDKLSKYLDRESRVIKCWKHLAYVLDVPAEERVQFDMYTEHSPTEDLFNFLADIWNPDLKVQELKMKLKKIHRNDLIEGLSKGMDIIYDIMLISFTALSCQSNLISTLVSIPDWPDQTFSIQLLSTLMFIKKVIFIFITNK